MRLPNYVIFLSVLWGLFEISFVFWNRILRVRLPREIYCDLYSWRFYLLVYITFIFALMVFGSIYKLLKRKPKENGLFLRFISNKYVDAILTKLLYIHLNIIEKGPRFVYKYVFDHESLIIFFFTRFSFKSFRFLYYRGDYTKSRVIPDSQGKIEYVLLSTLPKFIVATVFLLDVLYFCYFYWFYKSLYFLIIPLLVRVWIFLIRYTSERFMGHILDECVVLKYTEDGCQFSMETREGDWNVFDYRNESYYGKDTEEAFQYNLFHIKICGAMRLFYEGIEEFYKTYKNWESLYIGLCYSIGFFCYAFSSIFFN